MEKQKTYKWQETNLALFGSDVEKKIKEASAGHESAWKGVGQKPELRVWRIEKFKVVAWPKKKYGKFHTGDSYIVYHCYKRSSDSDALLYDIFFWIGSESTQDEYATAAYKTVELDHFLKDRAIQHREVQYHETKAFTKLFKSTGVQYLEGGIESGFNHVEDEEFPIALYQIKGVRGALILHQVKLRKDSLNSGDVFLLDMGEKIVQWNGEKSNPHEKLKAQQMLASVSSDRGGKCKGVTIEEGQENVEPDFFKNLVGERKVLGITIRKYNIQGDMEDDEDVKIFRKRLYRLSDASGTMKFKRVARTAKNRNTLQEGHLNPKDVFIMDTGFTVYVWVGKQASKAENGLAISYAMKYIKSNNRPAFLPIIKMNESSESPEFKQHFRPNDPSCFSMKGKKSQLQLANTRI